MDIEELKIFGKSNAICPFFYSREAATTAELVLLPYNYLFDPNTRTAVNIDWKGAIVVIDEAHNLESFASDSASFEFSLIDLGQAGRELENAEKSISASANHEGQGAPTGSVNASNIATLAAIFLSFEKQVSERSQRAFWKTSILAMKCAKWIQTKWLHPLQS